jgi:hypothetical protein
VNPLVQKEDKANLEATIKRIIVDRTQTLEDPMVGPLDLIEIITITAKEVVEVEVVGIAFKRYAMFIKRLEIIILMLKWKIY